MPPFVTYLQSFAVKAYPYPFCNLLNLDHLCLIFLISGHCLQGKTELSPIKGIDEQPLSAKALIMTLGGAATSIFRNTIVLERINEVLSCITSLS